MCQADKEKEERGKRNNERERNTPMRKASEHLKKKKIISTWDGAEGKTSRNKLNIF